MRKPLSLLFFSILIIPQLCYSQDSIAAGKILNRHGSFSVSLAGGLSSSFGLYHMDGLDEDGWLGGECASAGSSIRMNCDYRFKKHKLELTATVGYNHNNYDLSSFINEEYICPEAGFPPSKLVTHAAATSYSIGYFSVGIKYPFYLKRFTFYLEAMTGFLICQTPAISFSEKYTPPNSDTVPWNVTQPSEIGFAYTISIGTGIEYHIKNDIFVLVSGGLGVALNTIDVTINSTYKYISNLPPENYYPNLRIQINNLEMGVGYEF